MTSPTTPSLPDALRACIELQGDDHPSEHMYADAKCGAFIRQHGPALEALLREREWRPIESFNRTKAMPAAAVPDGPLTFDAFQAANVARCLKWHPEGIESWSPSDWMTALTGELGELASLLKMRNRERDGLPGNKFSPTDKMIADELADVQTYLDLLAACLRIDLGRATVLKFNEVSERVGFTDRIELAAAPANRTADKSQSETVPEAQRDVSDHVRREVGKLAQWLHCMSYNDSYFGEPAGLVKSTVRELEKAVDPIYPTIAPAPGPIVGVTIHTATVSLAASPADPLPVDAPKLWALHIEGPDDVHPAPSHAHAQKAADWINERFKDVTDVLVRAVVIEWPHSPESHAEDVDKFILDFLIPAGQLKALELPASEVSP